MFDKKAKIKDYQKNFEESLCLLNKFIATSSRNLILVNVNNPFALHYSLSCLSKRNVSIIMPTTKEILQHGSLGGFLRSELNSQTNQFNDTLVLDFFDKLFDLYNDVNELVDDVNTNRDLFMHSYNSIIIFAPPNIAYSIKRYSFDFWSCASCYFDTTKWFCSTITIPIVKVRTFSNASLLLSQRYLEDKEKYLRYIYLKKQILKTDIYSHEVFEKLLNQISAFQKGEIYYFDLMNRFISVMTNNQTRGSSSENKYNDLKCLIFDDEFSLQLVDSQIMLAEYYYKYGKYEDAILCYQKSIQTLLEKWQEPELKDNIISYLQCNIVVCRYLIAQEHAPEELIKSLGDRFFEEETLSKEYLEFKNTYFSLVRFSMEHHSFAQHFDILKTLEEITVYSLPFLDVSESYNSIITWEYFIANDFIPIDNRKRSSLLDITMKVQEMIYHFINGEYSRARNAYKAAKYKAKVLDYAQLNDMIEIIRQNMRYLYKQSFIN